MGCQVLEGMGGELGMGGDGLPGMGGEYEGWEGMEGVPGSYHRKREGNTKKDVVIPPRWSSSTNLTAVVVLVLNH